MPTARATNGASDVAILSRVLEPNKPTLTPEAAHAILTLEFPPADRERMHQLVEKARQGMLTPREQVEIDNYERVGHLLDLMKSKARKSLKNRPARPGRSRG